MIVMEQPTKMREGQTTVESAINSDLKALCKLEKQVMFVQKTSIYNPQISPYIALGLRK